MKKEASLLIISCLILILTSINALSAEIDIVPEKKIVNAQEESYLDINLDLENETVYGFEITINRPEQIEISDYEFFEINENCMRTFVENEKIKMVILCPTNITETGITGTKKIIRINYLALIESEINMIPQNIFLSDNKGQEISINPVQSEEIKIIDSNISIELKTEDGIEGENIKSTLCIKTNQNLSGLKLLLELDDKIEITNITTKDSGLTIDHDNDEILINGDITANKNCTEIANIEIFLLKNGTSTIKSNNSVIIEEEEIRINDLTEKIEIEEKKLYLECIDAIGEKNDEVNIKIYLRTNYAQIEEIYFEQNYDSKIEYLDATKIITQNASLSETQETNNIIIEMEDMNLSENKYFLRLKYKITSDSGNSQLTFANVIISDINGEILQTTGNKDCKITIEEPVSSSPSGSSGGGGGSGSSSSSNSGQSSSSNSASSGGTNMMDAYSSLLAKQGNTEINAEGVFHTQTNKEETEEVQKSEEEIKNEMQEAENKKRRNVPIIIVALTAALGIAAVAIFELRK